MIFCYFSIWEDMIKYSEESFQTSETKRELLCKFKFMYKKSFSLKSGKLIIRRTIIAFCSDVWTEFLSLVLKIIFNNSHWWGKSSKDYYIAMHFHTITSERFRVTKMLHEIKRADTRVDNIFSRIMRIFWSKLAVKRFAREKHDRCLRRCSKLFSILSGREDGSVTSRISSHGRTSLRCYLLAHWKLKLLCARESRQISKESTIIFYWK